MESAGDERAAKRRKISGDPARAPIVMEEGSVGITEFASPEIPGFSGIVKHRYSDFLVHEIDKLNNVVRLQTLAVAAERKEGPGDEVLESGLHQQDEATLFDGLEEILGSRVVHSMRASWEDRTKADFTPDGCQPVSTEAIEDKAQRSAIHQTVRERFGGFFDTGTKDKAIVVSVKGSKSATRTDNWPKTRNASDYYEFTLYKENKDTMDAIGILSKMLRVPVRSFSFAGTKDKRAVTTQKATVHKVGPRKLAALNSKLIGIRVGDFREAAGHLMLGDLGGNRFSIFLRNVGVGSESTISGALEALKTRGFVNYFGLQRFGSGNTGTHSVGKELLGGRWEEAVRVLLQPKDIDDEEIAKARELYCQRDYKAAERAFPRRFTAERAVLQHFATTGHEQDRLTAILRIPRTLRMMYLHAYQSYVWNKVISYRLREYGHRVVVGDLVLAGKSVGDATLDDEGITEAQEAWPEAEPSEATSGEVNVIESEEQAQKHSIFDVVFPLPGHGVVYPPHCKAKYVEIMEADGMHPDDMKRPQKEFSLGGAYRSILARAEDLEWKMVKYSDPNANVCLTDLDRLKGADQDVKDDPNGAWAGVFVEFSLKPSCYATMMLRELTKQRSDVAFQAGQQH